jgi:large subunit ribosomal protein L21
MYAVIETGGKQYRVKTGDIIDVERLGASADSPEVKFDQVLMVGEGEDVKIGQPTVAGATVTAKWLSDVRGRKVIVFKYKKRKQYRRKNGHRQDYQRLRIQEISA